MVTATDIGAALGSLKAALDITKAMVGLRDAEAFRTRSIELQGLILEAYEKSITAREQQAALIEENRALEAEMAQMKAWGADKQRYELRDLGQPEYTRAIAYGLKAQEQGAEPMHSICPDCYQQGTKSILQHVHRSPGMDEVCICQRCGWEAYISGFWRPEHGATKSASRRR